MEDALRGCRDLSVPEYGSTQQGCYRPLLIPEQGLQDGALSGVPGPRDTGAGCKSSFICVAGPTRLITGSHSA